MNIPKTHFSIQSATGLNYETIKKNVLDAEPVQKRVSLSQVEIDGNGNLAVGGLKLRVAPDVIEKDLFKILSLQPAFIKKFGNITDNKTKIDFINFIKTALSLNDIKKSEINLIGTNGLITHILPGNKDYITNSFAIKMFEDCMDRTSHDVLITGFTSSNNGGFAINVRKKDEIAPVIDGSYSNLEAYNPGFAFVNNPLKGMEVQNYVERMVCTNGMVATVLESTMSLNLITEKNVQDFFSGFRDFDKSGFLSVNFTENLNKAMNVKASFGEIISARRIITSHSEVKKDTDLYSFLPEFSQEVNRLARHEIDYTKCSQAQLNNLPTKHSVWDIINRITDFGSHDYGFNADFAAIQRKAGGLFNRKTYDTENVLVLN